MTEIIFAKTDNLKNIAFNSKYINRHGLIAGATGTGKTATLIKLIEEFSKLGIPSFVADVKGDLSGMAAAGELTNNIKARLNHFNEEWIPRKNTVTFWDIYNKKGAPIYTSMRQMGSNLLGRLLNLNETRQGVLEILFKLAEDENIEINTTDDLKQLLFIASENIDQISKNYGLISKMTIAAIQRNLLSLIQADGDKFFKNETVNIQNFIRTDEMGCGIVNILSAEELILKPKLYSTFLLWLLTELFEKLPEIGDQEIPKFVLFFDEAHLLFEDTSIVLRRRIEQVVRLIRSKGVGVYFCSQKPDDIPENVLGQLGNRIQHALRAFTIKDQKAVKVAAETFPMNNNINVYDIITKLAVGEALVSTLSEGGMPSPVEKVSIIPPQCRLGPLNENEWGEIIENNSSLENKDEIENNTSKFSPVTKKENVLPKYHFEQTSSLLTTLMNNIAKRGKY